MDFPAHIPFTHTIGLELVHMGEGEAELRLALRPELSNSYGVAHGGLLMTALDVAMAHAARSVHAAPDYAPGAVTLEMKASFLRPGLGEMKVTGRLLHRTATLAFCEATVWGEQGQACATASGTFKFMRALPTSSDTVQALNPARSGGDGSS